MNPMCVCGEVFDLGAIPEAGLVTPMNLDAFVANQFQAADFHVNLTTPIPGGADDECGAGDGNSNHNTPNGPQNGPTPSPPIPQHQDESEPPERKLKRKKRKKTAPKPKERAPDAEQPIDAIAELAKRLKDNTNSPRFKKSSKTQSTDKPAPAATPLKAKKANLTKQTPSPAPTAEVAQSSPRTSSSAVYALDALAFVFFAALVAIMAHKAKFYAL